MESNGNSELTSNGGAGPSSSSAGVENGGGSNHGWQKVTNFKKQRRQETRSKGLVSGSHAESEKGKRGPESKVFQALEKEAESRRANREAMRAAANASATTASGELAQSESDGEGYGDEQHHADANGHANGEVKKPKLKKPKKPKVSVADAASAIDASDLSTFLMEISDSFSAVPNVQLMRCADYFARAFSSVSSAQFGWNKILKESSVSKAVEIPLCHLPEPVNKVTSDWLAKVPADALSDFVFWALNDIMNDSQSQLGLQKGSKGVTQSVSTKTKVAVLVVLGLVLRKKPDVLIQKCSLLRTSPQYQGQEKVAMLAWAYGQAAQGDLVVGMYLWVQNLLPLAVGKSSTPASRDIALQFIESVLLANLKKARPVLLNGVSRKGERLVPPAALDSVIHVAFPLDAARTKATERFLAIYPFIKELALGGSHRSKATKPVAQQLLPLSLAAASEDVPSLVYEACENFIWCLSQNSDCFKQWEKLHLDQLKGSIQILNYLCREWKDIMARLGPLDDLKKTMKAFNSKNQIAMQHAKGDVEMESLLKSAERLSNLLLKRASGAGNCFKATATVVASVSIVYGLYLLNPNVNPWGWDGKLLLSKTHSFFGI